MGALPILESRVAHMQSTKISFIVNGAVLLLLLANLMHSLLSARLDSLQILLL